MQIKFAQLLVTNEGRKTPTECAVEAGYVKDRATITASELQNPRKFPLVVQYIGEIRDEYNKKYEVDYSKHIAELGKIRSDALKAGAWSAAVNAEVARGKAAGLYIEQKIIRTGKLDDLSEEELEKRMKEIIDQYAPILEGKVDVGDVKKKQKQLRLKNAVQLKNSTSQQKGLRPLNKLNTSDMEVTSNEELKIKQKALKEEKSPTKNKPGTFHKEAASNSASSSSSHTTKE